MLKITILSILYFWVLPIYGQSNEAAAARKKARIYEVKQVRDSAILWYESAFELYLAQNSTEALPIGYQIGQNLLAQNKADAVLEWAAKLDKAAAKTGQKWHSLFAEMLRYYLFTYRKESEAASETIEKIVAELPKITANSPEDKQILVWLNKLISGAMLGRKQQALAGSYLKTAADLVVSIKENDTWLYADISDRQLSFYLNTGADVNYSTILRELQKLATSLGDEGLAFEHSIRYTNWMLLYDAADTSRLKQLEREQEAFYIQKFGANSAKTGIFYLNMGTTYKDVWRQVLGYDIKLRLPSILQSRAITEKGLAILEALDEPLYVAVSNGYRNIGFMMLEESSDYFPLDSVLPYFYRAYEALLTDKYKGLPKGTFPNFSDYTVATYSDFTTDRALQGVSAVYQRYIDKQGKLEYKDDLFRTLAARRDVISRNSAMMQNQEDLKSLERALSAINLDYFNAYMALWKAQPDNLGYADSLLYYSEQLSAASTQRQLNMEETFRQTGVPDDLANQYMSQRKEVERLGAARTAAQREKKTDLAKKYNDELIAAQLKMSQIDKEIQQRVPNYSRQTLNISAPNIKDIQAQLEPKSACYIPMARWSSFIICKDTFFYTPELARGIDYGVHERSFAVLTNPNFDPDSLLAAKAIYTKSAHFIFTHVFKYNALLKARNIDHLIVVSVRHGSKVPFELLLCSPADSLTPFGDMDYLLRHYAVQYVPSLSLLQKARQLAPKANNNGKLLAYAPTYDKGTHNPNRTGSLNTLRRSLAPLIGAQNEVKSLQNVYYGDYRLNIDANEGTFKQQLQQNYTIIHLAMHGLLDDKNAENSALAFTETQDTTEDNFLHAYEIALLKANAQLVVLSACETGIGKLQSGEGNMSIARYFVYAGVPALIATRWQVNDQTTAIIMEAFYKNMYNGIPIHQAIRQAQLAYLDQAKGDAQHPFFWAPYMNIGYTNRTIAIASKNWQNKYYLAAALGGLAVLLLLFWRMKRKK